MHPYTLDPATRATDLAQCAQMLRGGSRTFFAASLAMPRAMREPAAALYAFCRMADDVIDEGGAGPGALEALRVRLDAVYAGRPLSIAADRAFAHVVAEYGIPRALPEALLEGFAWDSHGRRYETFDAVCDYAARVAGTVGAMMTLLMGRREPEVLARACDLGVAMQLTNIARDVGEDARNGRLYLPRSWMREAGIDPDVWLASPVFSDGLARVVGRLLEAADVLYARAASGVSALPAAARPGIHAARILYAEIGREVERRGLDSVSQRAVVSTNRKIQRSVAVLVSALATRPCDPSPPLEAVRFLVDAVVAQPLPARSPEPSRRERVEERVAWLVDLFERLERREHGHLARDRAVLQPSRG